MPNGRNKTNQASKLSRKLFDGRAAALVRGAPS